MRLGCSRRQCGSREEGLGFPDRRILENAYDTVRRNPETVANLWDALKVQTITQGHEIAPFPRQGDRPAQPTANRGSVCSARSQPALVTPDVAGEDESRLSLDQLQLGLLPYLDPLSDE